MLSISMPWLPEIPDNKKDFLKKQVSLEKLKKISNYRLNSSQLSSIAKKLKDFSSNDFKKNNIQRYKLGILSNATYDLINDVLIGTALRYGIQLKLCVPGFNQITQQSVSPSSEINSTKLDAVLIAEDYRGLSLKDCIKNNGFTKIQINKALKLLKDRIASLRKNNPKTIIVQTVAQPPHNLVGNANLAIKGTQSDLIHSYNAGLIELSRQCEVVLFDASSLANNVGLSNWYDHRMWYHAKLPFSLEAVPLYSDMLVRILASIKGKSRKCLILDLDNTLWGGEIGDDGIGGIRLGYGCAEGEAFAAIQKMALHLSERGIILAVCSKNTEKIAKEPFKKHNEMILRLKNIASFKANWRDKASNIRDIALELNIGLDAMVFLDDNPAERELVRQQLPMVAVPEVGNDPALYPDIVLSGGYFETLSLTEDDFTRASSYQLEKKRQNIADIVSDVDSYLRSLKMEISFEPINEINLVRSTQLINKTNQFNLTTQRYSEDQVRYFQTDENTITLTARLKDKFGEYGLISVLICKKTSPDELYIDTWLMSCRVLKRRVEESVLDYLTREAMRCGVKTLVGKYIETSKNRIVINHYKDLGFEYNDQKDQWILKIESYAPSSAPISAQS